MTLLARLMPCPITSSAQYYGQDGQVQAGEALPRVRFVASRGTLLDHATGLVWL